MRAKTNTITINGRTYDARTGQPLETSLASASSSPAKKRKTILKSKLKTKSKITEPTLIKPQKSTTIPATASKKIAVTSKPVTKKSPATKVSTTKSAARMSTTKPVGRQPQKSQTLMRRVVKKPTPPRKAHAISTPTSSTAPKVILGRTAQERQARIIQYQKSSQIKKFATSVSPTVNKRTAHIPVAPAPVKTNPTPKLSYDINDTPPVTPLISSIRTLKEQHRDLFETAIASANNHKAKKHIAHKKQKRSRKLARLALGVASLVLLFTFFAYQQAPNLALKRASSTIGFTASVPRYRPSGFRMNGPVKYEPGRVVIDFRSNSDDRAYSVIQATDYADDISLRRNYLYNASYEPVEILGQTGYLYGKANLTWVRNGIWYNIQGYSDLSRDQLLSIASSLF